MGCEGRHVVGVDGRPFEGEISKKAATGPAVPPIGLSDNYPTAAL